MFHDINKLSTKNKEPMQTKDEKTESINKSIIMEYFHLTEKYQHIYGENCCVLLMVGSFYEIYSTKNIETNEISGKTPIVEVSQICNLNIAEKKNTFQNSQVVMAGFRDYTLQKYLQKLVDAEFTVVVYDQEKKDKEIIRKCSGIYSPGTFISFETNVTQQTSNFIMCVWMEKNNKTIIYGVSVINIFTGESFIFEYETSFFLNPTCFDELERFVSTYSPSEVIILSPFNEKDLHIVLQYSGIKGKSIHKINTCDENNQKVENCTKQKYWNEILSFFFNNDVFEICQEFQLYCIATQSFCFLLNFIQEHSPHLVRKIHLPLFMNSSYRLILPNHTLKQLNIIDDGTNNGNCSGNLSSVLSFLNKCSTPMGKRLFKNQLTNPTFYVDWLNSEYRMTSLMLENENFSSVLSIKKQLFQIKDIEKVLRQLVSHKVYPNTLYFLYESVKNVQSIFLGLSAIISEETRNVLFPYLDCDESFLESIRCFLEMVETHFHIENCKNVNSTTIFECNIIKPTISKELDEMLLKEGELTTHFSNIQSFFNQLMNNNNDYPLSHTPTTTIRSSSADGEVEFLKLHQTEKSGCSLQITKKRGSVLKSLINKYFPKEIFITGSGSQICIPVKDIRFVSASSTNDEIEFPFLNNICRVLLQSRDKMNQIISSVFYEILEVIEKDWFQKLERIAKNVAVLDVLCCKTYIAKENNYCCPEICSENKEKSFIKAMNLRHVLIEHIQQKEIYVPNNICLGCDNEDGILLFGVNAVGKTSLIRSLGICVIMAQSGMFVPCSSFLYQPYNSIFSRILGNDNLFKGLSTFQVEMSELRVILNNATKNSLILGDEICHGTENSSALSIFVSTLFELCQKKSSFIFSTHFNEIQNFEEVHELTNIKIKHMTVFFDRENDCLVYDRILKDGMGDTMYGLEICKSLYMPPLFLEQTYQIRNKYFSEKKGILNNVSSKYNAKKIIGLCEICQEKSGSEIHHLQEQKLADNNNFIQTFHKNAVANLVNICEKCHKKQHSGCSSSSIKKSLKVSENIEKCFQEEKSSSFSEKKMKKIKTTKGFKII